MRAMAAIESCDALEPSPYTARNSRPGGRSRVAVTDRGYEEQAAENGSRRLRLVAVSQPSVITRVGKRVIDLVVGVPLALLALPLVAVLAVGSAVSLRAWPLFVQRRVGKGGREFPFVKLRTLPVTTPSAVDKYHLDGVRIPAF